MPDSDSKKNRNPYAVPSTKDQVFTPIGFKQMNAPDRVPTQAQKIFQTFPREMAAVRTGLQLYCTGIFLMSFFWIMDGIFIRAPLARGPIFFMLITGKLIGLLIIFAGELKCLAVPKESDGYRYILLSVIFYCMSALIQVFYWFVPAVAVWIFGNFPMRGVQGIFGLIATFLFLTFLISLNRYLENLDLYDRTKRLRRGIRVFFVFIMVIISLAIFLAPAKKQIFMVVFFMTAMSLLVFTYSWLSRFSKIIQETAKTIPIDLVPIDLEPEKIVHEPNSFS